MAVARVDTVGTAVGGVEAVASEEAGNGKVGGAVEEKVVTAFAMEAEQAVPQGGWWRHGRGP